jgi:hypothetical protein
MDQDIKDRLDRIEKLASDNNRILAKMRRAQKNAAYRTGIYWLIIIIIAIASFYFVMPYLTQLGASYGIGNGTSGSTLTNLLNQYEASQKTTK